MLECIILLYEYTFDIFYKFTSDAVREDKISLPQQHFSLSAAIKGCSLSFTRGEGLLWGQAQGASPRISWVFVSLSASQFTV